MIALVSTITILPRKSLKMARIPSYDGYYGTYEDDLNNTPLSERYYEQFSKVRKIVAKLRTFSEEKIDQIMHQYYNTLGLNEYYFQTTSAAVIAHNMISVMTAKILHENSGSDYFPVIEQVSDDFTFIIARTSLLNRKSSQNYMVERSIETKHFRLNNTSKPLWRMQCFRSVNSIFDEPHNVFERLKTYFLQKPVYACTDPDPRETDLSKLLDVGFYENKKNSITESIFYKLNKQLVESSTGLGLVISTEPRQYNVYRIDVAFRREYMHDDFYSRIGDCITLHGCYSKSKYFDPLSNNVCILTAFISSLPPTQLTAPETPLSVRTEQLVESLKLSCIIPQSNFTNLILDRCLTMQQVVYTYCVSKFIEHFSGSAGPYVATIENFAKTQQISPSELYEIRSKLKVQPYTAHQIYSAVSKNLELVRKLFSEFKSLHCKVTKPFKTPEQELDISTSNYPNNATGNTTLDEMFLDQINKGAIGTLNEEADEPGLHSSNIDYTANDLSESQLFHQIKQIDDQEHCNIFMFFLRFNWLTLRTNFFLPDKLSLCFRFDPSILSKNDYPQRPYSILLVVGPHFVGFHIKFSEIARGGVRIVQSFSQEAYSRNKFQVFDEAYNLSYTQSLKNKDIPEGGSKGVILLNKLSTKAEAEMYTRASFMCYVDGMLDIMLPDPDHMVDRLNKEEIYFLGPDEHTGTGRLMDWAANHAKHRGCRYWRGFTTGKSPEMGGIPHDIYGMTTASIEAFVDELFLKCNLEANQVTRFLTGGPDGDLGSNAVLASKTKTLTIVDKSGVLHDPNGLNIEELRRLVQLRIEGKPTCAIMYNENLLSKDGFMVPEDAIDLKLPDGTVVKRGSQFRDEFHLGGGGGAALFNPCGGRPSSITPFNVHRLFNSSTGKSVYKYIVEGANVFITQDARRILERKGIILFKDASTNKGGVTSSSYEVLAAMVLDDELYAKHLCDTLENCHSHAKGKSDEANPFRVKYINEILNIIRENARKEFNVLWSEGLRTGRPRCDLTDILSSKIINLKKSIVESDTLFSNSKLVDIVLNKAIPKSIFTLVDLETIKERVPDRYLRAIFASYIASNFYYSQKFAEDTSVFAFHEYIAVLKDEHTVVNKKVNSNQPF